MWQVRFGNHSTWVAEIARTVDHTRFACSFGNLDQVDLSDFDCIVPLSFEDYDPLRSKLGYWGTKFWFPKPEVVRLCNDKLQLNRWLLGTEFAELVPPLKKNTGVRFPYILKKRDDYFGRNSFLIRNHKDEIAKASLLQSPDYFCQTYVPGNEEFALHLLVVKDQVVYSQTVRYEFAPKVYTKGLGHWPRRRTYLPTSDQVMTFARILVKLGYEGTCCIDYKMDGGAPKLLEINPRFGATLARDINRYLEAYLGSLGIMDKSEFRCHGIRPVQDNFKQRVRHRLRSYIQPWTRKLRRSARSIRDYLRPPI